MVTLTFYTGGGTRLRENISNTDDCSVDRIIFRNYY